MAKSVLPQFDRDASLEELAGVGRNRRFDDLVDDEENEAIQVICKRGTEIYPLARPSRAFYFGDRNLYDQEARRFDQGEKDRILNTTLFPKNLARFEDLKRACQRGFVIPFVGAGMSTGAGLPDWKGYLLAACKEAGLDQDAMRVRLDQNGDFEGVMNDIVTKMGESAFNLDFERDFKAPAEVSGPVTRLPLLFDSCAITTNFDRVLETAYERHEKAFVEKVSGRGKVSAFLRAIPAGERYLLKLHGNLDNVAERVLNRAEYDSAYGTDNNVHFDFPVPRVLRRLFTSYSFLFLGCSLATDRTIQALMRVGQQEGADNLPHHYAVLPHSSDPDKHGAMVQRLSEAHISAIWFPEGEYEYVTEILDLLLD